MAKQVTSWQANDGTLHDSECAAATRDVELIVEQSPLKENTPFARTLVSWLTGNAELIRETLHAHEMACPRDAVAAKEELVAEEAVPGVNVQASAADLKGHTSGCRARLTGYFRDCNCDRAELQDAAPGDNALISTGERRED